MVSVADIEPQLVREDVMVFVVGVGVVPENTDVPDCDMLFSLMVVAFCRMVCVVRRMSCGLSLVAVSVSVACRSFFYFLFSITCASGAPSQIACLSFLVRNQPK